MIDFDIMKSILCCYLIDFNFNAYNADDNDEIIDDTIYIPIT